jgi:hypothetical protein
MSCLTRYGRRREREGGGAKPLITPPFRHSIEHKCHILLAQRCHRLLSLHHTIFTPAMQSGHSAFERCVTQDGGTKVIFVSKIYFTHHIVDVTSAKNTDIEIVHLIENIWVLS